MSSSNSAYPPNAGEHQITGLKLSVQWSARQKLRAKGVKLKAEGNRLRAEGDKLRDAGDTLWAEGDMLWADSAKLTADGAKLWAEGDKLKAEGDMLKAEGNTLKAKGDELWAEGNKLGAESDRLWAEAIIEAYGNINLTWMWRDGVLDCELENGEIFAVTERSSSDGQQPDEHTANVAGSGFRGFAGASRGAGSVHGADRSRLARRLAGNARSPRNDRMGRVATGNRTGMAYLLAQSGGFGFGDVRFLVFAEGRDGRGATMAGTATFRRRRHRRLCVRRRAYASHPFDDRARCRDRGARTSKRVPARMRANVHSRTGHA